MGYEPPLSASFTAFNQGSSAIKQLNGALQITGSNDGTSYFTMRGFVQSLSTSTMSVEIAVQLQPNPSGGVANVHTALGAIFRESSTAKSYSVLQPISHQTYTNYVETDINSNDTTRVTNVVAAINHMNGPLFLRLRRVNTQLFSEMSHNRIVWTELDSRTVASVFTTAPNQVGIVVCGANIIPHGHVIHYLTGTS